MIMTRHRQCIAEMQAAVAAPENADPDLLRDAVAEYAEACVEANSRLYVVGELLRKGLRSEAIQAAEQEPPVLELVAGLDFPELPQLCQLLQSWGMAPPPPLDWETAAQLNEAYAEQQPLEGLLKKHRLLALARAPLDARITVLRQIRQLDPQNATWDNDLKIYEHTRIKQMLDEAQAARKRDDRAALGNLVQEISRGGWVHPPPADLTARIDSLFQEVTAEAARRDLALIADELNAAHAAFDVFAGRMARHRWEETLPLARLPAGSPLCERAAPALDWLAEQDRQEENLHRFEFALAALEDALDHYASREELEKLYHAASRIEGYEIPPRLVSRCQQRLASFELAARRRHMLMVAAVAGVLVVIGASVAWFATHQRRLREIESAITGVAKLRSQEKYQEALDFIASLPRDVQQVGAIAAARAELEQSQEEETARLARLASLLAAAALPVHDLTTETDDAALASYEADLQRRQQAVNEAKSLAKTHSEQARVKDAAALLTAALDEVRSRRLVVREDKFRRDHQALEREFQQITTELAGSPDRLERALNELRIRVETWLGANASVRSSLTVFGQGLLKKIDAEARDVRLHRQRREAESVVTQAVGRSIEFRSALEQLARQTSADSAAALQRTVAEAPLWEGMERWNALLDEPEFQRLGQISPERAAALLAEGQRLQTQYGQLPHAEEFTQRVDYLKSVVARLGEEGETPPVERAAAAFRGVLFDADLWMFDFEGERYYAPANKVTTSGEQLVIVYYAYDNNTGATVEKKRGLFKNRIVNPRRAPQSELAQTLAPQFAKLRSGDLPWEEGFGAILQAIRDSDLDPVLKVILLSDVADAAFVGSQPMKDVYEAPLANVRRHARFCKVSPWYAPEGGDADTRMQAERVLAELPDLESLQRQVMAKLAVLHKPSALQHRWVGWLALDRHGAWRCLTPGAAPASGDLLVVHQPAGRSQALIERIGSIEQGQISWREGAEHLFQEGRPLFVQQDALKVAEGIAP